MLNFLFIDTNDYDTFGILDTSEYPSPPSAPTLEVDVPGFNHVVVPFQLGQLNILNSVILGIDCNQVPLPDGLYKFKYSVAPSIENFVEKSIFRTDKLETKIDVAFLQSEVVKCSNKVSHNTRDLFNNVYLYLRGCKAAASNCDWSLAQSMYNLASESLKNTQKLLKPCNC